RRRPGRGGRGARRRRASPAAGRPVTPRSAMSAGDTGPTWRVLWDETVAAAGGRPQARWVCEEASDVVGDEFTDVLDEAPTVRMLAHLDAMTARLRGGEPLQYVL